jgi:acetolactate synthase regulatory subunit
MAFFGFRVRNPGRDSETDKRRTDRLLRIVSDITDEISAERQGLQRRYHTAATDAGFAVEAMNNATSGTDDRVEELSATIMSCERRIAQLTRQLEEIADIRSRIEAFGKGGEQAPR